MPQTNYTLIIDKPKTREEAGEGGHNDTLTLFMTTETAFTLVRELQDWIKSRYYAEDHRSDNEPLIFTTIASGHIEVRK